MCGMTVLSGPKHFHPSSSVCRIELVKVGLRPMLVARLAASCRCSISCTKMLKTMLKARSLALLGECVVAAPGQRRPL